MGNLIEVLVEQHRLDLTESEASVLALFAHGWSRRRISRHLRSTERTIDKHLRAIRDKFGHGIHLVELADSFGLRDLAPPRRPRTGRVPAATGDLLRGRPHP